MDLSLLALLLIAGLVAYAQGSTPILEGRDEAQRAALYANAAILFVAMGVVPIVWGWGTRVGGWRGMTAWFRLERPASALLPSLGLSLATYAGTLVLALGLYAAGYRGGNPEGEKILGLLTWPLAFVLSATAGLGEEVLFRGLVQRGLTSVAPAAVAIVVQGLLFGLFHASYGNLLQLVVPSAMGIAFGWVVHRTRNLWIPIGAHFLFDFAQAALYRLLPANGI